MNRSIYSGKCNKDEMEINGPWAEVDDLTGPNRRGMIRGTGVDQWQQYASRKRTPN